MSKKQRIHGERNRTLSNELLKGKLYYDWSITIAFYSAIHMVEDFLLPLTVNGETCTNIADVRKAYKMPGRHAARERLVMDNIRTVAHKYKWLDDKSRYARYTTYKFRKEEAEKAKDYLNAIIEECNN